MILQRKNIIFPILKKIFLILFVMCGTVLLIQRNYVSASSLYQAKFNNNLLDESINYLRTKGYEMTDTQIGKGDYGVVFLGNNHERKLCIKIIPAELYSTYESDIFKNNLIKQCPNITQLIEETNIKNNNIKGVALVTEYNSGGTLLDYVTKLNRNFNKSEIIRFTYDMSNAIKALHGAGYIHRDIHLKNIMIDKGIYKLIDFGTVIPSNAKNKDALGAWVCRAPEYILYSAKKTTDYNEKVDIWALGVVVYYLAYGNIPYKCFSISGNLLSCEEIVANQRHFCECAIPNNDQLNRIVLRCLEFKPSYRISADGLFEFVRLLRDK